MYQEIIVLSVLPEDIPSDGLLMEYRSLKRMLDQGWIIKSISSSPTDEGKIALFVLLEISKD